MRLSLNTQEIMSMRIRSSEGTFLMNIRLLMRSLRNQIMINYVTQTSFDISPFCFPSHFTLNVTRYEIRFIN